MVGIGNEENCFCLCKSKSFVRNSQTISVSINTDWQTIEANACNQYRLTLLPVFLAMECSIEFCVSMIA